MKLAPIVAHLRSDGLRGFGYDVLAATDLWFDKRLIRKEIRPIVEESSISDAGDYPAFCRIASENDTVFSRFRRSAIYMRILEHVTKDQGLAYLRKIELRPEVLNKVRQLVSADTLGGPRRYRFDGLGLVSPTTLRYVKVATDLAGLFGSLDNLRVAEIGVGYGGQCRVIISTWSVKAYELFDLPEALSLAGRFLRASAVDSAVVIEHDGRAPTPSEVDLVISNYAFSELRRDVQQSYLDGIVLRAKRGYFTYNQISPPELRSFTATEFAAMIPGAQVLPEEPKTAEANVIVAWGME